MEVLTDYFTRVAVYNWWEVVIELFSIGLIVYWVLEFLEGTRGERLFRGVLFILIAGVLILNLVVEKYGFERLQYLYRGFLIAVLIIAVAAFQPEIRRALMRIGQPRFLASASQQRVKTIEEIVTAVTDLAITRTGVIIVMERKIALGEFIETGVKIDAIVTADLLKTICFPNTTLHDMAIIIRGNRIAAARVQLPLAEAGNIDGFELGSRHRAAIGISAGSDSSVILVSEETGVISIAQEGRLSRNITETQLRKHLIGTMGETSKNPEKFWKFSKKTKSDTGRTDG